MLIEFSVANFRSIRDRQTLSLVASNKEKDLPENLVKPDAPGLGKTQLLKSAAIYGANASGKSNLYQAVGFMQGFVENSAARLKPGESTGVVPFRLDAESSKKPSEFEVLFVHEGVRYQYGFTLDRDRVYTEWLTAYPLGKPQSWFHRHFDSETKEYGWEFGQKLTGDKQAVAKSTRDNGLFLSTAAQLNHDQLKVVYEWFTKHLIVIDFAQVPLPVSLEIAAKIAHDRAEERERMISLLKQADLGILAFDVQTRSIGDMFSDGDRSAGEPLDKELRDAFKRVLSLMEEKAARKGEKLEIERTELQWHHKSEGDSQALTFHSSDESAGTLKFFSLLGPWLAVLNAGGVLFVDEIAAYMHPLLVRNLLGLMQDPKWNPQGAQLIFTTHDVTLLDTVLFRRDQIWLTEKDNGGATALYPLTDFNPRKGEALQKGYLAGRYGGIPFIQGDFSF